MTTMTWVVGSGGMLGSAVSNVLHIAQPDQVFTPAKIRWESSYALPDLAADLDQFLTATKSDGWQIIWCAGAGVTSTEPERLHAEFLVFTQFLDLLATRPEQTLARGSLFFASSAGAVYGGSVGAPFDESSETEPLGEYGIIKLRAEHKLEEFSHDTGVPVLIGRISNLYGPGQSLAKGQGLISVLCQASLRGRPTSIFVSLDTRRDYLYVDDCAGLITASCERLRQTASKGQVVRKLLVSGRSITIGSVIGEFRQVTGRRPLIIMGASKSSGLQGLDLRLKSITWQDLDRVPKTPLVVGISRTLADLTLRSNRLGTRSFV